MPGGGQTAHTWELAAWVAETYRRERILLVGDAAHVMPPSGGLGANTGIQDAHNLAWKLAGVLYGWAGTGLLDSYQDERRPVAELTCELSARLQEQRISGAGDDAAARVALIALGQGYRYRSGAIATEAAEVGTGPGRPGGRAPHLPLLRDGRACSSLDLYGTGFTLVLGAEADEAADRPEPGRWPVRIDVLRLGKELADPAGEWPRAHGVGPAGAVLVRPDGVVGWRAHAWQDGTAAELSGVLAGMLAR